MPEHFGHANPKADVLAIAKLAERAYKTGWERGLRQPVAVEVGVWTGATTLLLAEQGFQVFAVDHWCGSEGDPLHEKAQEVGRDTLYLTFCKNMGPHLFRNVFPIMCDSDLAASTWPRNLPIDLLFLDAGHTYPEIRADIALWPPLVAPGGIVSGHDFGVFPGVTRAVEETGPFERAGTTVWWRETTDDH